MAVDLLFEQPPSGPDLLFGWTAAPSTAEATIQATLPALTFSALAIPNANLALSASLPALAMSAVASYQSYAVRPTVGKTATDWQRAAAFKTGVQERREATGRDKALTGTLWQNGAPRPVVVEEHRLGTLVRFPVWRRMGHEDAIRASPGGLGSGYGDTIRFRTARASAYEEAQRGEWMRRGVRHQDGLRDRRRQVASGYEEAKRHPGVRQFEAFQSALYLRWGLGSHWQNAIVPPPGISLWIIPPPVTERCYTPNPNLLFVAPAATDNHLLFICERHGPPARVVPVRRVYFVINDVTLHRVADGAEVPAFSLELSLDASSWAWGFNASLPATALALVEPGASPMELLASVNGTEFRVLAEEISRERSFGEASIRITGRGRNAVLAAPYAPVMNFSNAEPRTARQLMDDVLTHDGTPTGIPLGWTVDWGLTDWNVPAGVFAHQGTWIEALIAIASAAGAILMPHRSALNLKVRHRYPVAPWEWNAVTPDFVLPAAAVSRESLRWQEKPAYNRVFVSGQEVGVLGQVTRAGTSGDLLAPMVVDALITEVAAARQRGLAVLSDTSRQVEVTLRLPVLAETGIIEPGAFVEYQDGSIARLGLVRSTNVQAGWPEVWQTLGVETHA